MFQPWAQLMGQFLVFFIWTRVCSSISFIMKAHIYITWKWCSFIVIMQHLNSVSLTLCAPTDWAPLHPLSLHFLAVNFVSQYAMIYKKSKHCIVMDHNSVPGWALGLHRFLLNLVEGIWMCNSYLSWFLNHCFLCAWIC